MASTTPDTVPGGSSSSDLSVEDVWAWVHAGWRDFKRAAPFSLFYGFVFVLLGWGVTAGLWALELSALMPVAVGGFALVGPLLAVGTYEISRRLEAGEPLKLGKILFVKTAAPGQIAMLGFMMVFLFAVWFRLAQYVFATFSVGAYPPLNEFASFALMTGQGIALLAVGTAVGGLIALTVFSVSALSLPMMMHRSVDVVTASARSVDAVRNNTRAMLLWAWIIALVVAVSAFTGFLALIVGFPVLGHATWHAYRRIIGDG